MLNKKQLKAFLGLSFIFIVLGYVLAPFSVSLYVDLYGNWEWEEYFTDDNFIYQCTDFRDVNYSESGLIGSGICQTWINPESGQESGMVYAELSYTFISETVITKAILDISTVSESENSFGKGFIVTINNKLASASLGHKIIDISEIVQNQKQFDVKLFFWLVDCSRTEDVILQHIKLSGISEIPQAEETPEWTLPPDDTVNSEPEPEKFYFRLSEYIRNEENPSLQRAAYRVVHGWLHLIKLATGVVI